MSVGEDRPPEGGSVILSLEDVSRSYARASVAALRHVSLTVERGEYVAVTGPSGSGKSTLLHLLCGLDEPTSGRVLFERREPSTPREWTRLRARRIGFVFQTFNLLPALTALENVEVPLFGVEPAAAERRRRARAVLSRVGLEHRGRHKPGELSGGECQRVAIARSLVNRPDVVLADEPTGNLDSATAADILGLLSEIHASEHVTLVVASHDPEVSARAGRTVRLLDGRVLP
jgi:putative ABC transport system ATP-binding protein